MWRRLIVPLAAAWLLADAAADDDRDALPVDHGRAKIDFSRPGWGCVTGRANAGACEEFVDEAGCRNSFVIEGMRWDEKCNSGEGCFQGSNMPQPCDWVSGLCGIGELCKSSPPPPPTALVWPPSPPPRPSPPPVRHISEDREINGGGVGSSVVKEEEKETIDTASNRMIGTSIIGVCPNSLTLRP